jgi:hypothetical protein
LRQGRRRTARWGTRWGDNRNALRGDRRSRGYGCLGKFGGGRLVIFVVVVRTGGIFAARGCGRVAAVGRIIAGRRQIISSGIVEIGVLQGRKANILARRILVFVLVVVVHKKRGWASRVEAGALLIVAGLVSKERGRGGRDMGRGVWRRVVKRALARVHVVYKRQDLHAVCICVVLAGQSAQTQ